MTGRQLAAEAIERTAADEEVIRRLVGQIDRTYATDGRASALQSLTELLRRLDTATLQALGVEREVDAEEVERER